MFLASNAAHLYLYAKRLMKLTKRLPKLQVKARQYAQAHQRSPSTKDKQKQKQKYINIARKVKQLQHDRQALINRLRHHYAEFTRELRKV